MNALKTVAIATFLVLTTPSAYTCTSLQVKTTDNHVFYARTLEGETDFQSALTIIPKGTKYVGTLPDGTQNGLSWTSAYTIVGMSAFGMPLVTDGINEKGLAAGNLMFPGFAEYQPFDRSRSQKTFAQWEVLTWILMNFATIQEVKENIKTIQVCTCTQAIGGFLPLHFVVHDQQGSCLVIEYVNGVMRCYDNPLGVLTNSPPFPWHMINLQNHINISATNVKPFALETVHETGLGQGTGMLGLPGDYTPPSRFVRMVALTSSSLPVTGYDEGLNLAMTLINNVDIPIGAIRDKSGPQIAYDRTYWTVVADLGRLRYYFKTYYNKDWRYVDMQKALSLKETKSILLNTPPTYKDVTDEF